MIMKPVRNLGCLYSTCHATGLTDEQVKVHVFKHFADEEWVAYLRGEIDYGVYLSVKHWKDAPWPKASA